MDKHTILFVDDEVNILNALKRLFRKEGYNILTANSGNAALEYFDDHNISLVVSDQRMPEMAGVEVLAGVKKRSPDTTRIMLTGYADIKATVAAINKGEVFRFIGKPWNDDDIKLVVRHALQQLDLRRENERLTELTNRQNEELKTLNNGLEQKVRERTKDIQDKNKELEGLYRELKTSFYETIRVMVGTMELLNPPLGGHSKRVAAISKDIARRMGLSSNEISLIEVASLLHDIGLMGLPQLIIKNGMKAKTDAEKEIYRHHPLMGQATLNMVKELKQVGILVKSHHERFDGKGFPTGLAGEEIPLGSRIIAVADTYDEIASSREFYSERSAKTKALEHIEKFSGFKFDPEIVAHFFTVLEEKSDVNSDEISVNLKDLQVGMVTSREIYTESGRLLLGKNVIIDDAHRNRLVTFDKVDPIRENVFICRDA